MISCSLDQSFWNEYEAIYLLMRLTDLLITESINSWKQQTPKQLLIIEHVPLSVERYKLPLFGESNHRKQMNDGFLLFPRTKLQLSLVGRNVPLNKQKIHRDKVWNIGRDFLAMLGDLPLSTSHKTCFVVIPCAASARKWTKCVTRLNWFLRLARLARVWDRSLHGRLSDLFMSEKYARVLLWRL